MRTSVSSSIVDTGGSLLRISRKVPTMLESSSKTDLYDISNLSIISDMNKACLEKRELIHVKSLPSRVRINALAA